MPVLEIQKVSKRFASLIANEEISLTLEQGEILALLGENGAGKTTLMNILFGHYTADSGQIKVFGNPLPSESTDAALAAGIGMVHQHFTLADNMTVLENVILGTEPLYALRTNKKNALSKINSISSQMGLNINPDILVAELSVGERQRVEILKALYRNARILILDEPTAVLTPQEVEGLFSMLRLMSESGLSVIIISHKLHEVLHISHRVVVLRRGRVVGEASTAEVDRDSLAEMIVGRQIERPTVHRLQRGEPVLTLESVSLTDKNNNRQLLETVDLQVCENEILGVAGVSGNGQSELAAVVSGTLAIDSGCFEMCGKDCRKVSARQLSRLGVARIPEDRHRMGIIGDMSVWENLLLEDLRQRPCWRAGFVADFRASKQRASELIELFDIRCASMDMPAKLLSGGNMQKLILARNFILQPRFILANQPVRGLDEGAIAFIHAQILQAKQRGSAILLISEDLDELLQLSDQIVVMHAGKLSVPYDTSKLTARMLGVLMTGGQLSKSVVSDKVLH